MSCMAAVCAATHMPSSRCSVCASAKCPRHTSSSHNWPASDSCGPVGHSPVSSAASDASSAGLPCRILPPLDCARAGVGSGACVGQGRCGEADLAGSCRILPPLDCARAGALAGWCGVSGWQCTEAHICMGGASEYRLHSKKDVCIGSVGGSGADANSCGADPKQGVVCSPHQQVWDVPCTCDVCHVRVTCGMYV
eukprot:298522-Chlamydomonas_euryale.AAC.1